LIQIHKKRNNRSEDKENVEGSVCRFKIKSVSAGHEEHQDFVVDERMMMNQTGSGTYPPDCIRTAR
jgi:hypothetical protein